MHTYILRRVLAMIPTLFGVTLISFLIMQLAPGDPALDRFSGQEGAKANGGTSEAYQVLKRDLQLDLPLVLNFRGFTDFAPLARHAAWFMGRTDEEILAELKADGAPDHRLSGEQRARLDFLSEVGVERLPSDLWETESRQRALESAKKRIPTFLEDRGRDAFPAMLALAQASGGDRRLRLGALRLLPAMASQPFRFIFPKEPKATKEGEPAEDPKEVEVWKQQTLDSWKLWWSRNEKKFPPPTPDQTAEARDAWAEFLAAPDDRALQSLLQEGSFDKSQLGFFYQKLVGPESTWRERYVAAAVLKKEVPTPLRTDVGFDASDEVLTEALANWEFYFSEKKAMYDRPTSARFQQIFFETQYAKMLGRLITFNFGRSSERTREPVAEKIWRAFVVSAPIMILSQLVIYLLAIPLGVLCAAKRGTWIDRSVSLALFLLYSIPAFIAAMLFLVFLCYGDFSYPWFDGWRPMKFFPMEGLNSPGKEWKNAVGAWGVYAFLKDYAWHIFLPTLCLSLFSLASVAMYARGSMLDVLGQDYIRTARSVGVSRFTVVVKHAFRNSMITVITLFAGLLPAMLGGAVLVETLFNIPGMGKLALVATVNKDIPTLMAVVYLDALVVMVSVLVTDLLYVAADPRISFQSQESGK